MPSEKLIKRKKNNGYSSKVEQAYSKYFAGNENAEIVEYNEEKLSGEQKDPENWQFAWNNLVWTNIIVITIVHLVGIYGVLVLPRILNFKTFVWNLTYSYIAGIGVTAGAHRFWSHRSFKANLPLRVFFMTCYLMTGMNPLFHWVRDHRVHHKFSETDADPHNSNRGFFFSHVGWLFVHKHPEVIRKGKTIDMTDILEDPVVKFEEKYWLPLILLGTFIIPSAVPVYFWNELWSTGILGSFIRYMLTLNIVWSVNSVAHTFGNKPYDKSIAPSESAFVTFITQGEGWHNYHHTFPSDYRATEHGIRGLNTTTILINLFAKIGWASDLKTPSEDLVRATILNRGDGSHRDLSQ